MWQHGSTAGAEGCAAAAAGIAPVLFIHSFIHSCIHSFTPSFQQIGCWNSSAGSSACEDQGGGGWDIHFNW